MHFNYKIWRGYFWRGYTLSVSTPSDWSRLPSRPIRGRRSVSTRLTTLTPGEWWWQVPSTLWVNYKRRRASVTEWYQGSVWIEFHQDHLLARTYYTGAVSSHQNTHVHHYKYPDSLCCFGVSTTDYY